MVLSCALYKDAPFVILDEPTAALDPLAEAEIYGNFNGLVKEKTAVFISHRLSSCKFCDEIAVFDKGPIVQPAVMISWSVRKMGSIMSRGVFRNNTIYGRGLFLCFHKLASSASIRI